MVPALDVPTLDIQPDWAMAEGIKCQTLSTSSSAYSSSATLRAYAALDQAAVTPDSKTIAMHHEIELHRGWHCYGAAGEIHHVRLRSWAAGPLPSPQPRPPQPTSLLQGLLALQLLDDSLHNPCMARDANRSPLHGCVDLGEHAGWDPEDHRRRSVAALWGLARSDAAALVDEGVNIDDGSRSWNSLGLTCDRHIRFPPPSAEAAN